MSNNMILSLVDQLPVFCRFGLRQTPAGDWVPDPQACGAAQLRVGTAAAHEATCRFVYDPPGP